MPALHRLGRRAAPPGAFAPSGGSNACAPGSARKLAPGGFCPGVPVAFGSGIALYFTASHEPVLSVSIGGAFCAAAFQLRRSRFFATG
jgi:competence protein ComEC